MDSDLPRFVVTGSGRCGTSWISRALTQAGVACGHEQVFNADTFGVWPDDLRADSSWMAATGMDVVDVPVVALVRHPLLVVKSFVEIGFFGWDLDNPTHGPLRRAFPGVYSWSAPQDRALDMWLSLTTSALSRAEVVLRLDQVDAATFGRLLGWCGADPSRADDVLATVPACNRHEQSRERTGVTHDSRWSAHHPVLVGRAWQLVETLGYEGRWLRHGLRVSEEENPVRGSASRGAEGGEDL